jgi:hypothetical protein
VDREALAEGFVSELEKLGGPRSPVADRSVGGLVDAFKGFSHHKRKAWANGIEAAMKGGGPAIKMKAHNYAADRQLKRALKRMPKSNLVDAAAAISASLVDELGRLQKHAGWLDIFRRKTEAEAVAKPNQQVTGVDELLEAGIKDDAERLARGENASWRRVARRMLAFASGGLKARGMENELGKQLPLYPGTVPPMEIRKALNTMSEKRDPGAFWWMNFKPGQGVPGKSGVTSDGKKYISMMPGRIGVALHEGGHHAARTVPGMDTDVYKKALQLSQRYGWLAGMGLVPNALLDDPSQRQQLSKWGPALAMLPSLPTIGEETVANIFGGIEAAQQGYFGDFASEALPGYGRQIIRAGTVPAGLWMVHKMKQKELAAEQEARDAQLITEVDDVVD